MKTLWAILKKTLFLAGGIMLWIEFASSTLYRTDWALNATGGNPMPNEWTMILLPVMLSIVFYKGYTKKGIGGLLFKILMGILVAIGLLFFIIIISSKP